MYKVNELVLYSTHGICKITDITEKDFSNEVKPYYELRPLKDLKLQIYIPVDSETIKFYELMNEQEANDLIHSFAKADQIIFERNYFTSADYNKMISEADREKVVNTIYSLILRKKEVVENGKKLPVQEEKALAHLQSILYNELALALKQPFEVIEEMIQDQIAVVL